MFDDDLDSQSTPATMFPFLSVLFCTIGALVIIMVIGSMRTTVRDKGADTKLENVRMRGERLAALAQIVTAMDSRLTSIQNARAEAGTLTADAETLTTTVEEENVGLADLEARGGEAAIYVEKADLARVRRSKIANHESTMTRWRASKAEVDSARSQKSELSRQIDAAKDKIATLKQEADRPVVRFSFGEDPEGRKPVLIELKTDGVLVRSGGAPKREGTLIPKDEASSRAGFLDELAASLTRPGADRYAVLLVRPGAVGLFYAATEKLQKRRAPYAAEPVEGNWKLVFETGGATPN